MFQGNKDSSLFHSFECLWLHICSPTYLLLCQVPKPHCAMNPVEDGNLLLTLVLLYLNILNQKFDALPNVLWWFSEIFTNRNYHGTNKSGNSSFFFFSLSFLGIFLSFLLYSHNHDNQATARALHFWSPKPQLGWLNVFEIACGIAVQYQKRI